MKRILFLLMVCSSVFAEEAVLIDFSKLSEDSFVIEDVRVDLATSSRSVENDAYSYTKAATSKQYGTVLGARVHFPTWNNNSMVTIQPPFEIPAYEDIYRNELGVLSNVGTIKSIAVNVYGRNFPYTLYLKLIYPNGESSLLRIGSLQFSGWRTLTYENASYVDDVKHRELKINPLYPEATPFINFGGFVVIRNANDIGGDSVVYFKDIRVIYDKAVLDTDEDIDDEGSWGIIKERESERKAEEQQRLLQQQELRDIEQQKMATEERFSDRSE
jgi:hypothetical protein